MFLDVYFLLTNGLSYVYNKYRNLILMLGEAPVKIYATAQKNPENFPIQLKITTPRIVIFNDILIITLHIQLFLHLHQRKLGWLNSMHFHIPYPKQPHLLL